MILRIHGPAQPGTRANAATGWLVRPTARPFSDANKRQHRGSLASHASNATISITQTAESTPQVHQWTDEYLQQGWATAGGGDTSNEPGEFLLPIMPLKKTKCPTETVQLQIFEPRYRLMFRLVNQSRSRRFGVALWDSASGDMQRVGALCELTHYIPIPERQRIFISARVVGRYEVAGEELTSNKPFVVARCTEYEDLPPEDDAEVAALEARLWAAMLDVRQLASKLFVNGRSAESLGDDAFSLEVRRWAPDAKVRAGVQVAAGSDPALMQAASLAGLLGDPQVPYSQREGVSEYICSDAAREVTEMERRSKFSFCLLRASDTSPEVRLAAMVGRCTGERLRLAEAQILEGRKYLAARSTLKDVFTSDDGM